MSPKIKATYEIHLCCSGEAIGIAAIILGSMPELHRETFPLTHQIHPQEAIPLNSSNCSIHLSDFYSKQLLSQELGECKTNKELTPHFCDSRKQAQKFLFLLIHFPPFFLPSTLISCLTLHPTYKCSLLRASHSLLLGHCISFLCYYSDKLP